MDSELFLNTPTFPKDTEYAECERCDGTGKVDLLFEDESDGISTEKMTCWECNGEGQLPIE